METWCQNFGSSSRLCFSATALPFFGRIRADNSKRPWAELWWSLQMRRPFFLGAGKGRALKEARCKGPRGGGARGQVWPRFCSKQPRSAMLQVRSPEGRLPMLSSCLKWTLPRRKVEEVLKKQGATKDQTIPVSRNRFCELRVWANAFQLMYAGRTLRQRWQLWRRRSG